MLQSHNDSVLGVASVIDAIVVLGLVLNISWRIATTLLVGAPARHQERSK